MGLDAPISVGDLIDRITILEIKIDRIADATKRANVQFELDGLAAVAMNGVAMTAELARLKAELRSVNEVLWDVEDKLRILERDKRFDEEFVDHARSVYKTNDERAALKRAINEAVGSEIVEEKSYAKYE